VEDKQQVPTTKKDIEKCSTCGVKFSSFASPKKKPLQKSILHKKKIKCNSLPKKQIQISCIKSLTKKNPNPCNKSKFLATNPSLKKAQILGTNPNFLQQILHPKESKSLPNYPNSPSQ